MTMHTGPTGTGAAAHLASEEVDRLHRWWSAANYLSVGQIYLMDNPLLREPLRPEHIKPRLLGHWGTTPGVTFVYAHLNRAIVERDLAMMLVLGPGHGGPAPVAAAWLEGTYSEVYPEVAQDYDGLRRLVTQFSFPGGIPSHAAPETPGSIHEGGELGYSLSHAFGAALDNPDLVVTCVVGDGEAETGPSATSWQSTAFLNPITDGAVLPILHLNGYKIASPSVWARMPEEELLALLRGHGYEPYVVAGSDPTAMHHLFAATLDRCLDEIAGVQRRARETGRPERPRWPMIVLRSPKGWTAPTELDGAQLEGSTRSHQVPIPDPRSNREHLRLLEEWMRGYDPTSLFDDSGAPRQSLREHNPVGSRRMSASPHANGGELLRPLRLPDFRDYAVEVDPPGATWAQATRTLGVLLRDVLRLNEPHRNFRLFSPDENNSNRLEAVLKATQRTWVGSVHSDDERLDPDGRLMEILSEHTCQGWLEGYLLTGRHGMFSCYEAFAHIVDSMVNQHAKWLKTSNELAWRRPIASLNYLLTSHVWRQDHNGFSHQDPGFIDHVINKKAELVRVYLPPDANTLLVVADHCLRSRDRINVVVAGKNSEPQYLGIDDALVHCTKGAGIWEWASNDVDREPDVVMACAGDVPTMEALAAVSMVRREFPELAVRVVNVVDLMRLQHERENPQGMSDVDFDAVFTRDRPVVFAYHGYPWLIHRLVYKRNNHDQFHVHGYREEGTTTTPFDMCVLNRIDRFHLAIDVLDRAAKPGARAARVRERWRNKLIEHHHYVRRHGEDMPEVQEWEWST